MKFKKLLMPVGVRLNKEGKKVIDAPKNWQSMDKTYSKKELLKKNATGLRTGYGMYVIDIDTKKIPKKYKKFMKALGKPTVETARGYHYYVISDVPMTNHQDIFDDKEKFGVDIRGRGGFVYTEYRGKAKGISYTKVSAPIKDTDFKVFKMLPKRVREPKAKKKKAVERGDVGKIPLADVKSALKKHDIKKYANRDKWMSMLAAIYHGGGAKAEKIARKWSKQDKDNYDSRSFDKVWNQLLENDFGSDISVGTLFGEKEEAADAFKKEKGSVFNSTKKDKKKKAKKKAKVVATVAEAYKANEDSLEYNPQDFPKSIRDYMINATGNMSLNFSASVPHTMMLMSQMLGDSTKIQMKGDWVHTPVLWGLNVAGAGVGKSPLIKTLSKPIWDIQMKMKDRYDKAMKKYKIDLAMYKIALKNGGAGIEPEMPKQEMIITSKTTPEALYTALGEGKGMTVWKDEIKALFVQNEKTDILRTDLISAWSGQSLTSMTKTQGTDIIKDPYIRVGGNVQPDVIKEILRDNKSGFNADGFIVRFQMIAHLKETATYKFEGDVDEQAKAAYNKVIKSIYKNKKEQILVFDSEAKKLQLEIIHSLHIGKLEATSMYEKEFLAKGKSLLGSLVAILHAAEPGNKNNNVVSVDTVQRARNIMNVSINNAFHLYDIEKREKVETEQASTTISSFLGSTTGKKFMKQHKKRFAPSAISRAMHYKVNAEYVTDYFESNKSYIVTKQGRGSYITRL